MERCRGMESVVGIVLNADGPGLGNTQGQRRLLTPLQLEGPKQPPQEHSLPVAANSSSSWAELWEQSRLILHRRLGRYASALRLRFSSGALKLVAEGCNPLVDGDQVDEKHYPDYAVSGRNEQEAIATH